MKYDLSSGSKTYRHHSLSYMIKESYHYGISTNDIRGVFFHKFQCNKDTLYLNVFKFEELINPLDDNDRIGSLNLNESLVIAKITENGVECNIPLLEEIKTNFTYMYNFEEISDFLELVLKKNFFVYKLFFCDKDFESKYEKAVEKDKAGKLYSYFAFYNLLTVDLNSIEKIYKGMGEDFLISNLSSNKMSVTGEKKKLKQALGLPQQALDFLKIQEYSTLFPYFRTISENRDNNDIIYILTYIDSFVKFSKNEFYKHKIDRVCNFVKQLAKISECIDSSMKQVITYLHRQRMFYSLEFIDIPLEQSISFADYLSMAKKHKVEIEKFPADLSLNHFFLAENTRFAEDISKNNNFISAVKMYKHLEHKFKDYSIICPKDISDMIREGNMLHHCIGSYVDNVINGQIVLFLRENSNIEQPFIDFEVNSSLDFVQIKEKYDNYVSDLQILDLLIKWTDIKRKEN